MQRYFVLTALLAALAAGQTTYLLQTLAGSDDVGDGGPPTAALIAAIQGLTVDSSGALYLSDADGHRIRKVSAGVITTIAGNGHPGFTGDGGPAAAARINTPYGIAADRSGNLYIADLGNARIRRISPDGLIRTIAGGGTTSPALADGRPATEVAFKAPRNVAADSAGNVYFTDFGDHRVYQITPAGVLLRLAGTGSPGFSGDNSYAPLAQLNSPAGIAVDSSAAVYVADSANGRVRKIWRGLISTLGDPNRAGAANPIPLGVPTGLTFDTDGSLVVADPGNSRIVRVTPAIEVTTIAQTARDIAIDAAGALYTSAGSVVFKRSRAGTVTFAAGSGIYGFSGDGGPALKARFNLPTAIARAADGTLFIADRANHRIRKISPDGSVSTAAGNGVADPAGLSSPSALALDPNGNLYIADTGNHRIRLLNPAGALTTAAANIHSPSGLALDVAGNLYIADTGSRSVLRMAPSGALTTVAANLDSPHDLACDQKGNLYISDSGAHRVLRLAPSGTLDTYPASDAAVFIQPRGLALDDAGNLYLADAADHRIFRIEPSGRISTIAGEGWPGFSGELGDALSTRLDTPTGLATDPSGILYIADTVNNRIRRLIPNVEIAPPSSSQPSITIVNAASLLQGPIVPDEIVSIFGSALGQAQVSFNGRAAQVFYASDSQLNVLVPSLAAGARQAEIQVLAQGEVRARATVSVAPANPGLFTRAEGGTIAVHEDGSLNSPSNPALRGSVIVLYATGQGDGSLATSLSIGDYPAELLYAGPAPGFPGLMQINARVPAGFAPPGNPAVVLRIGDAQSQPGLTIATR